MAHLVARISKPRAANQKKLQKTFSNESSVVILDSAIKKDSFVVWTFQENLDADIEILLDTGKMTINATKNITGTIYIGLLNI
jgi:hypothetical protein